ncbi:hypothetical protein thsrh120_43210 [Rhizobium sp. No.120]
MARETVAIETLAIRATSSIVAGVEFDTALCLGSRLGLETTQTYVEVKGNREILYDIQ